MVGSRDPILILNKLRNALHLKVGEEVTSQFRLLAAQAAKISLNNTCADQMNTLFESIGHTKAGEIVDLAGFTQGGQRAFWGTPGSIPRQHGLYNALTLAAGLPIDIGFSNTGKVILTLQAAYLKASGIFREVEGAGREPTPEDVLYAYHNKVRDSDIPINLQIDARLFRNKTLLMYSKALAAAIVPTTATIRREAKFASAPVRPAREGLPPLYQPAPRGVLGGAAIAMASALSRPPLPTATATEITL